MIAELAIAVALVPGASRLAAAIGPVTLLAILTVAVAANLARGNTPAYHCFGGLSRGAIGSSTLARWIPGIPTNALPVRD